MKREFEENKRDPHKMVLLNGVIVQSIEETNPNLGPGCYRYHDSFIKPSHNARVNVSQTIINLNVNYYIFQEL